MVRWSKTWQIFYKTSFTEVYTSLLRDLWVHSIVHVPVFTWQLHVLTSKCFILQILAALEEDEFAKKNRLTYKLEQVRAAMESEVYCWIWLLNLICWEFKHRVRLAVGPINCWIEALRLAMTAGCHLLLLLSL